MKRLGLVFAVCAVAAMVISGCTKGNSGSDQSGAGSTSGPITDSASNGLKANGTSLSTMGDAAHGKEIFAANCASCHGAQAEGGVGPNLHGEKKRKDYLKTIAWIKDPQPPMSKLYPSPLGESDVADVAAYVQSL